MDNISQTRIIYPKHGLNTKQDNIFQIWIIYLEHKKYIS